MILKKEELQLLKQQLKAQSEQALKDRLALIMVCQRSRPGLAMTCTTKKLHGRRNCVKKKKPDKTESERQRKIVWERQE